MGKLLKEDAVARLRRQQEHIDKLKDSQSDSPEFRKWQRDTEVSIERIFGKDTRHLDDFTDISYTLSAFSDMTPDSAWDEAYEHGLETARSVLASFIGEVQEYWDDAP